MKTDKDTSGEVLGGLHVRSTCNHKYLQLTQIMEYIINYGYTQKIKVVNIIMKKFRILSMF